MYTNCKNTSLDSKSRLHNPRHVKEFFYQMLNQLQLLQCQRTNPRRGKNLKTINLILVRVLWLYLGKNPTIK